jgi:hypothetical protein
MRKTVIALVLLCAAISATTASASAATASCETSGSIKLSPGLSAAAQVQNVTIKGTLKGCVGEESTVTTGKFEAHYKTAEPVTCATLTGAGAAAANSNIVVKWAPKGQGNSMGSFSMPLTEVAGASLGGLIESGPFTGATIGGSVSESYAGGSTCGVPQGKKKAKKVNKGTFVGTLSV